MSSDDYFDDELDSAFLHEVDAIEAAQASTPKKRGPVAVRPQPKPFQSSRQVIEINDSDEDYDLSGFNDDALQVFDQVCAAQGSRSSSSAKPVSRKPSMGTVQTNLFGQIVSNEASSSKAGSSSARKPMSRTNSSVRSPFAGRPKKTKQWDHTAFAKYGWKKPKGKGKASFDDGEEEEEDVDELVEFEQFPAPSAAVKPPPPMKLKPDLLASKRWLYPLNKPKRDYQFNIVKRCLFDNTLVAIPTGLGKTFIAGVVMLNFYNWYPEGKVVFVAPTRPLVAQQIEACHQTCGIPGSDAVELTGQNPRNVRARAWQDKRVFYMTPQTLMNDLRNETCDCRDIVLLVVDEAHKGTGDYAYAQVVRYLMASNPYFRLLALTATPGSTPEAVQTVVDSLHISHVEIRDEESLDLRQYMHEKRVEQHIIAMNDNIVKIADLLAAIMQPLIQKVQSLSLIRGNVDAKTLHPYRCQTAMQELHHRRDKHPWAFPILSSLGALARAMGYLYEGSMSMCYNSIHSHFIEGKKSSAKTQQDSKFQDLMSELHSQRGQGFAMHPKKEKLLDLIVQHFGARMSDDNGEEVNGSDASRVMIFSTYRENVDELVDMLNEHQPLIRAVRFIGQGTDKQGRKGYAQKEQMEVIKKFKAGDYNVLVSTSVGEEGLDIGEVDMIVCYESQKTPIRMLQRIGRTGRKKDGVVHVLLAEGREDRNWDKAKENYQQVQHFIVRAEHLELYDDVHRMLPDPCKPECIEMVMDIQEYNREEATKKASARSPGKTSKRKRNDDVMRNIPDGAATSFVSVKDLLVKGTQKKKQAAFDSAACDADDDDRDILDGIDGPRRASSLVNTSKTVKAKNLRRASTHAGGEKKKKRSKKEMAQDLAVSKMSVDELQKLVEDDSDDMDIEEGFSRKTAFPGFKSAAELVPKTPSFSSSKGKQRVSSFHRSSSPEFPLQHSIIDLTTPDVGARLSASPPPQVWSSPPRALSTSRSVTSVSDAKRPTRSPSVQSRTSDKAEEDPSLAWLIADDDDPEVQLLESSPSRAAISSSKILTERNDNGSDPDDSVVFVDDYIPTSGSCGLGAPSQSSSMKHAHFSQEDMPPPALPPRFTKPPSRGNYDMPPPTFAVRAPGRNTKKRIIGDPVDSSPVAVEEPVKKRNRIRRRDDSSPAPSPQPRPKKKSVFRDASEASKHNPWVQFEADHSGDERSVGSSEAEDMDEYDPSFVVQEDYPETQVSPSYDQNAIYRESLLSQAPGRARGGPSFANKLARRGRPIALGMTPRRPTKGVASSSPARRTDEEPDEYVFGSFIVDDDEDISYMSHSSDG